MDPFSVLLAFLTAAVAFAGFTGVVALIDQTAAHVSREVISFRIKSLISSALCVLVLSSAPMICEGFGLSAKVYWRGGCALIAVVGVGYLIWVLRARGRLTGDAADGLNTTQFNIMTPLGAVTIMGLVAAVAGAIPPMGMYLMGDFFFLLISATVFLQLVLKLEEGARRRQMPDGGQ